MVDELPSPVPTGASEWRNELQGLGPPTVRRSEDVHGRLDQVELPVVDEVLGLGVVDRQVVVERFDRDGPSAVVGPPRASRTRTGSMVQLSTAPPFSSGYGETSVPPPAKLIRSGAFARTIGIVPAPSGRTALMIPRDRPRPALRGGPRPYSRGRTPREMTRRYPGTFPRGRRASGSVADACSSSAAAVPHSGGRGRCRAGSSRSGRRSRGRCSASSEKRPASPGELGSLVGVYSDPDRDPRKHTVSVVFRIHGPGGVPRGGDDAAVGGVGAAPPVPYPRVRPRSHPSGRAPVDG